MHFALRGFCTQYLFALVLGLANLTLLRLRRLSALQSYAARANLSANCCSFVRFLRRRDLRFLRERERERERERRLDLRERERRFDAARERLR